MKTYEATANELVERLSAFAKEHPEVYELTDPWDLFKLGFKCDDLGPSLAQASWALARVQQNRK